jgi:hypothetical protein
MSTVIEKGCGYASCHFHVEMMSASHDGACRCGFIIAHVYVSVPMTEGIEH